MVAELIEENDDLVTCDLKDGFHHVKINFQFQKYLGMCWYGAYYGGVAYPLEPTVHHNISIKC